MIRPVYVSGGAGEFRYIQITETNGVDISGDVIKMTLLPYGQRPDADTVGQPPDRAVAGGTDAVMTVGIMIDAALMTALDLPVPGTYRTWAKVTDSPEIAWLEGGVVEVR